MVIDPTELTKEPEHSNNIRDAISATEYGLIVSDNTTSASDVGVVVPSESEITAPPSGLVPTRVPVEPYDPWRVYDTTDAYKDAGEPPWVIENLLMADSATLVSAQPKAMKSLSLLQACMDAVHQQRVWGRFKAPKVKSTLFIETEDTIHLLKARVRGLSKGLGLKEGRNLEGFHYACVGPFRLVDEVERLSGLFDKYKPDFTVVSTLQNIIGDANWNTQHDMQPIMEAVIKLARQCPMFLVTHSPQDKKQKRAAGSITQAANFAGALHYEKKLVGGVTSVHVRADSKAGAALPKFSLRLETEGPTGNPESVRRLVYDAASRQSAKAIIEDALVKEPDLTNEDLADLANTGLRNVQKIRRELSERSKKPVM